MQTPFQFSLRTLLVATVAAAVVLAIVLTIVTTRGTARPALVLVALGALTLLPCAWVASFRWRKARRYQSAAPSLLVIMLIGAVLGAALPFAVVWLFSVAMRP